MARSPEPDEQKENADSLAGDIGVEGIEALPKRVAGGRSSKLKKPLYGPF